MNKNNFKIVPLSFKKNIIIEGTPIEYAVTSKVLGLTINRTGIEPHVKELKNKAILATTKLY